MRTLLELTLTSARDRRFWLAAFLALWTAACATSGARLDSHEGSYGVLVMAHGGSDEWDSAVTAAVEPLAERFPTEVAFGMADAVTIEQGVERLEAAGVDRIGVVRLFISGESWYERTEQILGLVEGAPARPDPATPGTQVGAHGHHGQADGPPHMEFWRIRARSSFALSREGLSEASEMDQVLLERARNLSRDPTREDLLVLAHGPGDDAENARWIANIEARARLTRDQIPFRRVEVMTLREDWTDKREQAEKSIRAYVQRAADEGGTAIVIPFRVQGFGPYAGVLEGLDYRADGVGLLPHSAVSDWLQLQAQRLREGTFAMPPSDLATASGR